MMMMMMMMAAGEGQVCFVMLLFPGFSQRRWCIRAVGCVCGVVRRASGDE